ncbi:MAG: c-type cytochrome [Caldilinea sp.]
MRQRFRFSVTKWMLGVTLLIVSLSLAACGGATAQQSAAGGGGQPVVVPTMPPARFTPVPQQAAASSALMQPTASTQVAADEATTVNEQILQRGATIFVNRKCYECHGEQAEGITDKGATLAGTQLTLSEFTTVLRTGKSGEIGPDHIFGPSAISPGGVEALYAWLQSLPAP